MKKNNPHTPIMLRDALNTEPIVFARYGMLRLFHRVEPGLMHEQNMAWKSGNL